MIGSQEWRAWRLVRVGLGWTSFVVFFAPFGFIACLLFRNSALPLLFLCTAYVAGLLLTLAVPDARTRRYLLLSLCCLLCLAAMLWMGYAGLIRRYWPIVRIPIDLKTLAQGMILATTGGHAILATLALRRIGRFNVGGLTYDFCNWYLFILIVELSLLGMFLLADVVRSHSSLSDLLQLFGLFGIVGTIPVYFGYAIELMVVSAGVSNMRRHPNCD